MTDPNAAVARLWNAVERLSFGRCPTGEARAYGGDPVEEVPTKASRSSRAQKGASESHANKNAEVISLMKRAKGATLPEIMEATGWQKQTVRRFISILGSKGGEKIESAKNASGERTYKLAK